MSTEPESDDGRKKKVDPMVLYDTQFIKRHLDDYMIKTLKDKGYKESVALSNSKILITAIAVVAAVCSHFVLKDFKNEQWLMRICIAIWFVCSFALGVLEWYYGGGWSGATYLGFSDKSLLGAAKLPFICAISSLPRYDSSYRLILARSRNRAERLEEVLQYNEYYTEDGVFLADKFELKISNLITTFEEKKTK